MKKLELFFPVKAWIVTQPFGTNGEYYRANGIDIKGHNGLDLYAIHGQPVYAAHDGEVVNAGIPDSKEGYGVVLRTLEPYQYGNGESYFKTICWHLLKEIPVRAGQKVMVGDIIGYADNTGFSNGDHLHFGLKPIEQGEEEWLWQNREQGNGYYGAIDPTPYFNGYFSQDTQQRIAIMRALISAMEKLLILLKGR